MTRFFFLRDSAINFWRLYVHAMRVHFHAYWNDISSTEKFQSLFSSQADWEAPKVHFRENISTTSDVLVFNPISAAIICFFLPVTDVWILGLSVTCAILWLVLVCTKKPPSRKIFALLLPYAQQVCTMVFLSVLFFAPFILLNEMLLRALYHLCPAVSLPNSIRLFFPTVNQVCWLHFVLRVAIMIEMVYHRAYYMKETQKHLKYELTGKTFALDLLYSSSYSVVTSFVRIQLIRTVISAIRSVRPDGLDLNVFVLIVFAALQPYLLGSFVTNAYQYAAHKMWHKPCMFFTFHADHHQAVCQSALVGGGNGFWEMIVRLPMEIAFGDIRSRYPVLLELFLTSDTIDQVSNIFHHHYYDDCPTYRFLNFRLSTLSYYFFRFEWLLVPKMESEVIWYNSYPAGEPVSRSLHGRHHWATESHTFSNGIIDRVDELKKVLRVENGFEGRKFEVKAIHPSSLVKH